RLRAAAAGGVEQRGNCIQPPWPERHRVFQAGGRDESAERGLLVQPCRLATSAKGLHSRTECGRPFTDHSSGRSGSAEPSQKSDAAEKRSAHGYLRNARG